MSVVSEPAADPPPFFIENVRFVVPGDSIFETNIRFERGLLAEIGSRAPLPGDTRVKGGKRLLTPGLIDIHTHALYRNRFDCEAGQFLEIEAFFARYGTTCVLPTLTPLLSRGLLANLEEISSTLERVSRVKVPGLHLEGPFLALPGAGTEVMPGDPGLLAEILAACRGRVSAMSVSPDTPGIIPVIERLREEGVVPFVTHTRADLCQARSAIAAGARHATHFYDVFPFPPEETGGVRPPGVVEAFLADPSTTVDFIADGCHVDPVVIKMAVRAMGCRGVAVITDGNIGAGLPPGIYPHPGGCPVKVGKNTGTRISDPDHPSFGVLIGSSLTMDAAMANVLEWLDEEPENIWQMGTSAPAAAAGLDGFGKLAPGSPADAVLWESDLSPAMTWLDGRLVYENNCLSGKSPA